MRKVGRLEVICGGMFSGKSEELIRRIKRAMIAKQQVVVFKPVIDDRFDPVDIVSHSNRRLAATPIEHANEIPDKVLSGAQVVGIDEAQFFGEDLINICEDLADTGLRVIVAGLDLDYLGKPFPPMPQLMAVAEEVCKLAAVCMRCGDDATRSYRLTSDKNQIVVGAADAYEARCRSCSKIY